MCDKEEFPALLEDSAEDLYEHAPCGYLSTLLDGQIARINQTLLGWLGHTREELVGRRSFTDLLTVGGRIYHETHFAPLLRMQGEAGGITFDLRTATGDRLPVLVTAVVKTSSDGEPLLIRITVFDARDRRAYEQELLRARRQADLERERFQRLAATLQRSLLPPAMPEVPGLEAAAYYHIASRDEVGGDFYDLFPLGGGRWGFFVGDVCGKGAKAATVTSLARYTLRATAVYEPDPVAVLSNLNTVMLQESKNDIPRFCTVVLGVLTLGDGAGVTLASGGHPPALLLRADGSVEFLHTLGGQLVGALPEARFVSRNVHIGPGDTLLLYTDGLPEARTGAAQHRYEEEALYEFARTMAPIRAADAVATITELLAGFGEGLEDDTAVLALGVPL
jgi:phosphoserine phosphatase RsbU/P